MALPSLLIVDDDVATCAILTRALHEHYAITTVRSADAALSYLTHTAVLTPGQVSSIFVTVPDLILINVQLPGEMNGLALIRAVRPRRIKTILMTSLPDAIDITVEAMKHGAAHVIQKNFDLFQLPKVLDRVLGTPHPDAELDRLGERLRAVEEQLAKFEPNA